MSELRLRVGGRYQSQKGPVVEIEHTDGDDFSGRDIEKKIHYGVWRPNGNVWGRHACDTAVHYGPLISEITPEQENKMETFFALITGTSSQPKSLIGKILEMTKKPGEIKSLNVSVGANFNENTDYFWFEGGEAPQFVRLDIPRSVYLASWGIKEEVKPKELPPKIKAAFEKAKGTGIDAYEEMILSIVQYFESRMEEGKK